MLSRRKRLKTVESAVKSADVVDVSLHYEDINVKDTEK